MRALLEKLLVRCVMPPWDLDGPPAAARPHHLSLVVGIPTFTGGIGSAVIVARGLAVTAAHVLALGRGLRAFRAPGEEIRVTVLAEDPVADLAVLAVPPALGQGIPAGQAVAGEPVWALGTTDGAVAPVAAGRIERVRAWACLEPAAGAAPAPPPAPAGFHAGLMYRAEAGHGYSGGPVVNARGEVVGMTRGIYTCVYDGRVGTPAGGRLMFACHIGDVLRRLERLLD